ncbi:ABC transporter ATP-binding protein [Devosia sp. ZW T5_3]|uniref:ABC transporter ATP-binding protein n=1 Tax=Devosia sp. ZW T5_3 TaxID=3378085 RepID=UPI0038523C48
MIGAHPDIVVKLTDVTVDIPLRGLKKSEIQADPRIRQMRSGRIVLRALDKVSLEIRRGERIGIIGGNGNGKTTLLKLIAGILPAASGEVHVQGSIRSLLTIGAGTVLALTGRQNVHLRYALLGIRKLSLEEYVQDVADFAELGAFFDLPVGTYSPGMQSRLQFAMSTVEPAAILLLDEWMGVADRDFQQKAHDRLVEYIKSNEAFVFASHNENLLREMTDRTLNLKLGKII